jgi:hypothetical protein
MFTTAKALGGRWPFTLETFLEARPGSLAMERIEKKILVGLTASDLEILEKLQSLTGLRVAHIIRFALRALLQRPH